MGTALFLKEFEEKKIELIETYKDIFEIEKKDYFIKNEDNFLLEDKFYLMKIKFIEDFFLLLSKYAFGYSINTNPRSNDKLKFIHSEIGFLCKLFLFKNSYNFLSFDDKNELQIIGSFNDKKVDISIDLNNVIEIKFPLNNIKQNQNNMIETLSGATLNLINAKKNVLQIIFFPEYTFYKNNNGVLKKIEKLSIKDIKKYYELNKYFSEEYFFKKEFIKDIEILITDLNNNNNNNNNIKKIEFNLEKYKKNEIGFASIIPIIYNHGNKEYFEDCIKNKKIFNSKELNLNNFKLSNLEFLEENEDIKDYINSFAKQFLYFLNLIKE